MAQLDRIIAFDRETALLTVEAGIKLGELARVFAPQGWLPAVLPATGFATMGGAIAMDVHGMNHHNAGSFCQLEKATMAAGGRIYLAKDALSSGAAIKAMYPEFSKWAAVAVKADPDGLLQTDMTRRLDLRATT